MASPYRVEESVPDTRAELVYVAGDRERHVAPARSAMQIGIVGGIAGVVAAGAGFPAIGAGVLGLATALGIWRWRRAPEVAGITIAVERGDLHVTNRTTKKPLVDVRLVNLLDVALDTKSIRKVVPGKDAIPAVQFINTSVGPEVDVARIVFHLADEQEPVRLSDQFLAHMDAVEWVGKIRSFLRKQGWVPVDEREAPPSSQAADDD
jgi:hypothetical protein